MSAALERLLPRYQFVERHRILVSAPVAEVYAAVAAMDLADSSIARTLMALWRIPARVILANVPDRPMSVRDFLQLHEHPPTDLVRGMIGHRRQRESQIRRLLEAGHDSIEALVPQMYKSVDQGLWPAAGRSVLAHLIDMERREVVARQGENWQLTPAN